MSSFINTATLIADKCPLGGYTLTLIDDFTRHYLWRMEQIDNIDDIGGREFFDVNNERWHISNYVDNTQRKEVKDNGTTIALCRMPSNTADKYQGLSAK